jgi:hypothetical protein
MEFFKNLNAKDFREFISTLILLCIMCYLFLPGDYTDASIRGSMLTLLGVIIKHYFGDKSEKTE